MQGRFGHFFEIDRLRVRHIVCIILPSAKLHHADNCFPQMVVFKDCPVFPVSFCGLQQGAGFFVCSLEIIYPAVQIPQQQFCLVFPSVFPPPILIRIVLAVRPIDPAVMSED